MIRRADLARGSAEKRHADLARGNAEERRAAWLARLSALLAELQPELGPLALSEADRLGEDLGLDSLAFEALFARLREELGEPASDGRQGTRIDAIAWLDALEAGEGRVAVLLDLIEAAGREAHA